MDLLLVLNAGLPGMCTIHANAAREALVKMCTLPLLGGDKQGSGGGTIERRDDAGGLSVLTVTGGVMTHVRRAGVAACGAV